MKWAVPLDDAVERHLAVPFDGQPREGIAETRPSFDTKGPVSRERLSFQDNPPSLYTVDSDGNGGGHFLAQMIHRPAGVTALVALPSGSED